MWEWVHKLKQSAAFVWGKEAAKGVGVALSGSPIGVIAVSLTAAVSAAITQLEYLHKRKNIKALYREELGAKLGKSSGAVNDKDLQAMSDRNPTIGAAVKKAKRQRNFGIVMSVIASIAALSVVVAVEPHLALSALGTGWLAKGAEMAVAGMVGLTTYHTVKAPLHWIADKVFGLDKETAHDRIAELARDRETGATISREQTLSVFARANPQIDRLIASEYGARFDDLSRADKHKAVEDLSKMIPLGKIAHDINSGKVNVSELAFAVEGEMSGVKHQGQEPKKRGFINALAERLGKVLKHRAHVKVVTVEAEPAAVQTVEYAQNVSAKSFAERFSSRKLDPALGYAEQVEQSRLEIPATQR